MFLNELISNFKINITNLLFSLIPVSFIAGNLILNLNIVLLIIFALIFYKSNIFFLQN